MSSAADARGVSTSALRHWEKHRCNLTAPRPHCSIYPPAFGKTVVYARVPSDDLQADVEGQKQVLELYCASQGWTVDINAHLSSGMNYRKRKLKRMLDGIVQGEVGRLVLRHKDQLLRSAPNSYLPFTRRNRSRS